jgi:hypothetical protein
VVKLLDFGGAHQHGTRVIIQDIWGNCRYIWSNLVRGASGVGEFYDVTPAPDCYALALMVLFVLTGIRPYSRTPDNFPPDGRSSCDHIWELRRGHIPAVEPAETMEILNLGTNWEPVAKVIQDSVLSPTPPGAPFQAPSPRPAQHFVQALEQCGGYMSH